MNKVYAYAMVKAIVGVSQAAAPENFQSSSSLILRRRYAKSSKGICHPDDARRAIGEGMDGIYCSNLWVPVFVLPFIVCRFISVKGPLTSHNRPFTQLRPSGAAA